jgi:fluoroquinolone resistance protein
MNNPGFFDGQSFSRQDYTISPLPGGEYDGCTFLNCNFSNSDLTDIRFLDCTFDGCDLSLSRLTGSVMTGIKFLNCKMLGLLFETCNKHGFSAGFDNCILDHSSFSRLKLRKTIFRNVTFHEADFSDCDLSGSVFDRCDLGGAVFENSVLEKTDFRSAINFSIDPEKNKIRHAMFSLTGLPGLLEKYHLEIDHG